MSQNKIPLVAFIDWENLRKDIEKSNENPKQIGEIDVYNDAQIISLVKSFVNEYEDLTQIRFYMTETVSQIPVKISNFWRKISNHKGAIIRKGFTQEVKKEGKVIKIKQKEVDVRLALDLVYAAQNMKKANFLIFSKDTDITPALFDIKNEYPHIQVDIASLEDNKVSTRLAEYASTRYPINQINEEILENHEELKEIKTKELKESTVNQASTQIPVRLPDCINQEQIRIINVEQIPGLYTDAILKKHLKQARENDSLIQNQEITVFVGRYNHEGYGPAFRHSDKDDFQSIFTSVLCERDIASNDAFILRPYFEDVINNFKNSRILVEYEASLSDWLNDFFRLCLPLSLAKQNPISFTDFVYKHEIFLENLHELLVEKYGYRAKEVLDLFLGEFLKELKCIKTPNMLNVTNVKLGFRKFTQLAFVTAPSTLFDFPCKSEEGINICQDIESSSNFYREFISGILKFPIKSDINSMVILFMDAKAYYLHRYANGSSFIRPFLELGSSGGFASMHSIFYDEEKLVDA